VRGFGSVHNNPFKERIMLKTRIAPLALLGLLALASQASAQTVPDGGGTLDGRERLRIPGCGREAGPISVDVALAANGAWTAEVGAVTYSGTSTQANRRLARLTLDAGSLTTLDAALEADATALCEETVTISSLTTNALLKVNKRQTRARLHFGVRATGSSTSGDGSGSYRIRARGPWTAVGT
jgi:hypothetical protein